MNIFCESNLSLKLKHLNEHIQYVLSGKEIQVPEYSSRDVIVLDLKKHPDKKDLVLMKAKQDYFMTWQALSFKPWSSH